MLIITHDLDSLIRVTDRIAALVDRKAVVGTFEQLRRDPHPWLQQYFGGPRGRAAIASAAGNGPRAADPAPAGVGS